MHLFVNTHVRINIYRELYHGIIYIANEGRHVRIIGYAKSLKCYLQMKLLVNIFFIFFFILHMMFAFRAHPEIHFCRV